MTAQTLIPTRFAGWRILAVAVATSILTGPGQTIGVSVFIDPMVDALGVSRSVVSTAYLVGTLTGASAMPFVGRYIDRHGVRRSQILIGLGFTAALINMAGVRNALWLAVGFAGIRMMGQGALSMVPTVAVSLWFERRRGVAMGVLATVAGAGMVAVPVVLNAVIEATSWRWAWLIAAGFTLVTVIPLGWFALIDRPSDAGQRPDGDPASTDQRTRQPQAGPANLTVDTNTAPSGTTSRTATPSNGSSSTRSFTRAEAVRTRQFWTLAAVSTVTGMLVTGLNFHQIDLLGEAGLSSGQAAAMFLPQIVGSSVAGISIGYVMDRVGVRLIPALGMVLLIVVHLLGVLIQPGVVVVLYAISMGATGGAVRACLSTMLPGYFGTDHIGSIQGLMTLTGVLGSALGPVTLSLAEARFGGYQSANLVLMILPVITLVATLANRSIEPSTRT